MKFKGLAARLVLSMVTAVSAAGSAVAADWTVGANIGNVPWEFQDAAGKFVGFEPCNGNSITYETAEPLRKVDEYLIAEGMA